VCCTRGPHRGSLCKIEKLNTKNPRGGGVKKVWKLAAAASSDALPRMMRMCGVSRWVKGAPLEALDLCR
jgi:hypothetical protein